MLLAPHLERADQSLLYGPRNACGRILEHWHKCLKVVQVFRVLGAETVRHASTRPIFAGDGNRYTDHANDVFGIV